MAEYKGKLLRGLFTQAKNVLMNSGKTVEETMPIFLTFPKTDVAITVATGAVYRSAPIECDTGISLTNKKLIVGADGAAWIFLNSVSGTKFTVTLMRSSSATIDSTITVCISD